MLERSLRLVYVALWGYGASSRWRGRAGRDLDYLTLAGLLSLNGPREGGLIPRTALEADLGGAMALVVAVLAGLPHRERTGQGFILDASMLEVIVS
ncbi:MAG: CoA transferase [Thermoflexus sp.]|nr:CoA transferase [Thermoflexus sp.]